MSETKQFVEGLLLNERTGDVSIEIKIPVPIEDISGIDSLDSIIARLVSKVLETTLKAVAASPALNVYSTDHLARHIRRQIVETADVQNTVRYLQVQRDACQPKGEPPQPDEKPPSPPVRF